MPRLQLVSVLPQQPSHSAKVSLSHLQCFRSSVLKMVYKGPLIAILNSTLALHKVFTSVDLGIGMR
jgi:hypothetical protein